MKPKKPKKRDHALEAMLRDEAQYQQVHREALEEKPKRKQKTALNSTVLNRKR